MVENKSKKENFIFTLNESFYEVSNLYYYDKNWIKKSTSVFTDIEKRDIKTNHLTFDITLKPDERRVFYLELKGKYAYFGNLELFEKSYYYFSNTIGINALYIFMLGTISIIVLFNLFLFVKSREKIYIYYAIYSFFNIIYILNLSGLLVYINMQKYIYELHLSASFMMGFLLLFSLEYLETKKYLSKYHRLLQSFSIPFFILGVLVLFSYTPWNKFINNLAGLICILLIVLSVIVYFKGHNKTKYYIFVISLYFIFVVLFAFMVNGTFEYTSLTRYGFIVTTSLEISVFTLLLANRHSQSQEDIQLYLTSEVNKRTKELKLLVSERELLLKEVYHRVKNNFHMVIGMLWFESRKKDKSTDSFTELINRIKSMSMIHEQLYNSKDLTNINMEEYLNKIIFNIINSFKKTSIKSKIENIDIEFEHAISLCNIVNEILTNSIKHNTDIENFTINILVKKKNNVVYLSIKDSGLGFEFNLEKKGLGLKLVEQFCRKLPNSKNTFTFKNGTKFELTYKIIGK
jgi:two-component sensor histidine kinase